MIGKQMITPADIQLVLREVAGATDDEVEAAYREVGRKVHRGNPSKADQSVGGNGLPATLL